MENNSFYSSSYPDSRDSSPRSRENDSWDDQQQPPQTYKVKFMCSYGGKILPRPHDNQLTYVGGETKILAVDRNVRFPTIVTKLASLYDNTTDVCFKYQLPGEDLDALISVTNDEDLEHMMLEYDRVHRSAGSRPARLRLFLFPLSTSNQSSFSADDPKPPNQQWFVDALNSVPTLESSSPPSASNTDFLFGFEKQQVSAPPVAKLTDLKPEISVLEQKIAIGSDSDRINNNIGGGDSMFEIQRQIQELHRLQIANQEQQQAYQRKNNEGNLNFPSRAFQGDYFIPEKPTPAAVPVPAPTTISVAPTTYWQDRQIPATGAYPDQITAATERQLQQQQQVYLIPTPGGGMYQTQATNMRQVTGQVGHGGGQSYYGMQRAVPDVYREQPVYSMGPPPVQPQMQQQAQPQMAKMMMGMGESGGYTTQVAYDNTTGRQVYYTTTAAPSGGGVVVSPSYQTAVTTMSVDPRVQSGLNQEGKVLKPPQM